MITIHPCKLYQPLSGKTRISLLSIIHRPTTLLYLFKRQINVSTVWNVYLFIFPNLSTRLTQNDVLRFSIYLRIYLSYSIEVIQYFCEIFYLSWIIYNRFIYELVQINTFLHERHLNCFIWIVFLWFFSCKGGISGTRNNK